MPPRLHVRGYKTSTHLTCQQGVTTYPMSTLNRGHTTCIRHMSHRFLRLRFVESWYRYRYTCSTGTVGLDGRFRAEDSFDLGLRSGPTRVAHAHSRPTTRSSTPSGAPIRSAEPGAGSHPTRCGAAHQEVHPQPCGRCPGSCGRCRGSVFHAKQGRLSE